jgi:hypothetical protein
MDRAGEFLEAVAAVEAGTASLDQAREVFLMASLSGRNDLVVKTRAILGNAHAKKKAA